jgi:acetoin utilization protein AcuB
MHRGAARQGAPMKVAQFMTGNPCCIQRGAPLHDAHRVMRARHLRHLPVLDHDRLVGILSERDLYLLETLRNVDPGKEPVSEAMTEIPFTVTPDASVRAVVQEMRQQKYGSAVVVEGSRVVGIFTRTDALRALESLLT